MGDPPETEETVDRNDAGDADDVSYGLDDWNDDVDGSTNDDGRQSG